MNRSDFKYFLSSLNLSSKKLMRFFDTFYDEEDLEKVVKTAVFEDIFLKDAEKIKSEIVKFSIDKYKNMLLDKNVKLVTFEDDEYPNKLRNIDDPPFFLFCKGDKSLLNKQGVAIIGTRMPTTYGKIVTEKFARELAEAGLVIISGLAYGVDSISHRQALDVKGKTIAVLGGGFDKIYPSEHTNLAKEIEENGLLVSEYSPDFSATKYTFPQRNRIVAGLSNGVLITEAGEKSGTIITKDYALDSGIDVYAIPGNITSSKSDGTNNIIAHSQGMCVLSPKDILDNLGISSSKKKKVNQLSFEENLILEILEEGEKTVDFLCEKTKLNINKLNSLLVSLEIKGVVRKSVGGGYILSN